MLGLALSRNAIVLFAIIAFAGSAVWLGDRAIDKHDQKVARAAVAEAKEEARAKVKVAKRDQRRVVVDDAQRVLNGKYCTGC